jgi:ethanolamine ammonia-lyase small subunit
MAEPPIPARDPFAALRAATPARIGLGRTGQSLTTDALLALQGAEALARGAVFTGLDVDHLAAQIDAPSLVANSAAPDRPTYLRNPGLGRRLDPRTPPLPTGPFDLVLVIADGLSAAAANAHAPPLLRALLPRLADWRVGPIVLALQARVALGDAIGEAMTAKAVVVLIGERPGLSAADSLGAYLTWGPRTGRIDSERNCVSNIRPAGGLSAEAAADKIAWLLTEARRLGFTGVDLKDREATGPSLYDRAVSPSALT